MNIYGATAKLNEREATWCLDFIKTHQQSLRVERIDDFSGWEPVLPQDMIGCPIEEFGNKAISLYKWLEQNGTITRAEKNQLLDDHWSLMERLQETLEDGVTINHYEQAAEFLDAHFSLNDPVLYLAPSENRFESTSHAPKYRAVKLNCLPMPLGKRIDVRGLYCLIKLSGYQEYNSSGAPREGHIFLISRLQASIASRFWTTTDPSVLEDEEELPAPLEDVAQLTGKSTDYPAYGKPPQESGELTEAEPGTHTPTPQGAAMLAALAITGNLEKLSDQEANIMYLIPAKSWPKGLAKKIESLLG